MRGVEEGQVRHIKGHHGIRTMREAGTKSRVAQQREGLTPFVKGRAHDPGRMAFKRNIYTGFCRMNRSSLDS